MSPAAQAVLDRLEDARQRWWVFSLLCNVLLMAWASLALLVAFVLVDVVFILPQVGLAILFGCWCLATAALLGGVAWRVFRRQRNLEGTARRVEMSLPELGNDLINLIQLAHSANGAGEAFRRSAIEEAAARVREVRFHVVAQRHSRWARWRLGLQTPADVAEFALAFLLLVGLVILLQRTIPTWASAADRLFQPWAYRPQTGAIQIQGVTPGDAEIPVGARLEIMARISDPGNLRPQARLYFTPEGERAETTRVMVVGDEGRTFRFCFPAVTASMRYRLQIGDSQTETYRIGVCELPDIQNVEVTYEYPGYLERPSLVVQQKHMDLQAPQYTVAHSKLFCSTRISRGHVQLQQRQIPGQVGDDGRSLQVSIPLNEQGTYTIHLFGERGHSEAEPRVNHIRVEVDAPPSVELLKPPPESTAAPASELPVVVRAVDDHGLGCVRLEWKEVGGDEPKDEGGAAAEVLHTWDTLKGAAAATLTRKLVLEPARFPPGATVLIRAVARDRRQLSVQGKRLEPQETASSWHRIRLVTAEQAAAEDWKQLENLTAKLWAILQTQVRARVRAAQLGHEQDFAEMSRLAQEVRQRQVEVHTATADLAASLAADADPSRAAMKQSLSRLATGEMLRAVQQAEAMAGMKHEGEVGQRVPPLLETQDRIIQALRALLDQVRKATSEALAELKQRPGGDLPGDVQEKLMKLAEKLQDFLRQQKRVIEATENLAKKPVEDFTEEDEQLIKELAAAEDEWSRFMEEAHSDFSKLPEQDFANPSLLQELVEVQTELQMAQDALTKKAADIAVPLEQLGAEMAEEMTTNLEKWLPDTPDRERWSQEEPLSDEMKEAPMAELPGELEDIVGELMEQEEDLFDEMEDVSSSWADSLDKGAGWDAMDGPISNMSARGVTGNRLPNTSEIGGRSGEGRQGQASGEMVSDTAVGKGGRKTPSRLAPDPYVKGQVKDFSKDPVGGATGGGKESGAGGAGLEGPLPPQQQRELDRLANKQADLRNRAESAEVNFQVRNYHRTDLKKIIAMMAAVERDLRSGRYQSALRRREIVLDGLSNVKTYLEGEFQVRRDQTTNLPEEIQKALLGNMLDGSPAGWEELNRKYFERLAVEPAAPASARPTAAATSPGPPQAKPAP